MKNRSLIHKSLVLLSTCLIASATLAQTPAPASTASIDKLRTHVTYLASDKLQGRRTGTKGASEAADYIAMQFVKMGLVPFRRTQPKYASQDYLQAFPYVAGVSLARDN